MEISPDLAGMDLAGLRTHQVEKSTGDVSFLQLDQIPVGEHTMGGIGRHTRDGMVEWPTRDSDELVLIVSGAVVVRVNDQLYLFKNDEKTTDKSPDYYVNVKRGS